MKHFGLIWMHLGALLAVVLFGGRAPAQQVEDFGVEPPGTSEASQFGSAVAIDGDWAVVGDHFGGTAAAPGTGACTLYRRGLQGWESWQTLTPTVSNPGQLFGSFVTLHGDELVVGSKRGGQDFAGRAYVYRLEAGYWVEIQQLRAFDGGFNYAFGASVAFDAETLVVGSTDYPDATHAIGGLGTCYVYERGVVGWEFSERLPLPDHTATPHDIWTAFGWSCAVENDLLIVGAPSCSGQGMAFTYRRVNGRWQPEAELYLPQFDPLVSFCFGDSVGVSAGTIAVGAPVGVGAFSPGASTVWMFDYDQQLQQWTFAQALRASDWNLAQGGDQFGTTLALHGDRLVVGADRGGLNGPVSGTAYIFERSGGVWTEIERLIPSDPNPSWTGNGARFASSVALDGQSNRVIIGAQDVWSDAYQGFPGKAYFYDLNQGTVVCDGFPNLTQTPTRLTVTGNRTVSNANLSLSVYDAPAGYMGLFLVGPGGPAIPFGAGGSLCVGQPFSRLTGIQTIGPEGSAMHQVDFTAQPASSLISPGATLTFQFAHRDLFFLTGAQTINASHAVEVVFE